MAPGETFVSALVEESHEVVRREYAIEAWDGPTEGTVAWWRSKLPATGKPQPAPREALLSLLDEWAGKGEEAPARYLLALLLVRRRVLRPQTEGLLDGAEAPGAVLRLVGRDRAEPIEVPVAPPSPAEAPALQARLSQLLGAA